MQEASAAVKAEARGTMLGAGRKHGKLPNLRGLAQHEATAIVAEYCQLGARHVTLEPCDHESSSVSQA